MKAAVLGSPIAHSLSPVLHAAGYAALGLDDWTYTAIECDEAGLPALVASCGPDWAGLSLTMPLKRAVLPLLDTTDPVAAEVGGANTVVFNQGRRQGYNTDVPGMVAAMAEAGVTAPSAAVVLGAGATACSALAALRDTGLRTVTGPAGTSVYGTHVEYQAPVTPRDNLVLVHGGGGQALDMLATPDGRPGWSTLFLRDGFTVYTVDRPGLGRSPYHPDIFGPLPPPAVYGGFVASFAGPSRPGRP